FFFFFQAEDGIRDFHVTGVQTCALPISGRSSSMRSAATSRPLASSTAPNRSARSALAPPAPTATDTCAELKSQSPGAPPSCGTRSEERRVGKESRSRGRHEHGKEKGNSR